MWAITRNRAAGIAVAALSHLVPAAAFLAPAVATAYEARVFDGAPLDATAGDLLPRKQAANETFYAENYSFTFQFDQKITADVKFGMTNVLGSRGGAYVATSFRARGFPFIRDKRSIPANQWKQKDAPFALDLKSAILTGDASKLRLTLAKGTTEASLDLVAVVPGWKPGSGKIDLGSQGFIEVIIWPKMIVTGTVKNTKTGKSLAVTGYCVMTHAVTTIPPQFQPARWFYFRGNDLKDPVLFQAVQLSEQFGSRLYGWFIVVDKDRIVASSNVLDLTPTDLRPREDGVQLPWGMYFKDRNGAFEGGLKATLLKKEVDRLKTLPKLEAAIIRKLIQPRMYLFDGELAIAVAGKGAYRTSGMYKIETIRR